MHLRHMAVIDGKQAIGILDLDKARGQVCHDDPKQSLLVEEIYEPLNSDHCLRGESPLIDYILTADERPFRLVELGGKLHTIDVSDLQKTPVRVLLFMRFAHLETLLARQLCIAPGFLDSGVTVFASTLPRPARRGRVVPERGFGSCTSLASTARCTSA